MNATLMLIINLYNNKYSGIWLSAIDVNDLNFEFSINSSTAAENPLCYTVLDIRLLKESSGTANQDTEHTKFYSRDNN
jgi:hypothetical protein